MKSTTASSTHRRHKPLCGALLAILLAGCGGGGDAPAVPTLVLHGIDPTDGATGVSRLAQPQLAFSAPLDVATLGNGIRLATPLPLGNESFGFQALNGTVTLRPTLKLLPAASYQVRLNAQLLRGALGEQLGASLTRSFTTQDGAWQGSATLDSFNGTATGAPDVALPDLDNAMAVWAGPVDDAVRWSQFTTGWSPPLPIETIAGAQVSSPKVGDFRSGSAIAVWVQRTASGASIRSSRFTGGSNGTWGLPIDLFSPPLNHGLGEVQLAVREHDGMAIAVWDEFDGTRNSLRASHRLAGGGWSMPHPVETGDVFAHDVQLVIRQGQAAGTGEAIATWSRFDGTRDQLAASRFTLVNGVGSWSAPVTLQAAANLGACPPSVTMHRDGTATTIWCEVTQPPGPALSVVNVWSNTFRDDSGGGQWLAPIPVNDLISRGNFVGDVPAIAPRIAEVAGTGESVAVWTQVAGPRRRVWISRRAAAEGAVWSQPEQVAEHDAGATSDSIGSARVVADRIGNLIVTWKKTTGQSFTIWSRRWQQRSASWGQARFEADLTSHVVGAGMQINASGDAVLIWPERLPSTDGLPKIGIRSKFFQ